MIVFFILDSGSDWSQGVYLTQNQGFDTASEGRGEEGENLTESFPKKIKVYILINLACIISMLNIVVYLKLYTGSLKKLV